MEENQVYEKTSIRSLWIFWVLNVTFVYCGPKVYWWRKLKYLEQKCQLSESYWQNEYN